VSTVACDEATPSNATSSIINTLPVPCLLSIPLHVLSVLVTVHTMSVHRLRIYNTH
jgi:hypothetical protein